MQIIFIVLFVLIVHDIQKGANMLKIKTFRDYSSLIEWSILNASRYLIYMLPSVNGYAVEYKSKKKGSK